MPGDKQLIQWQNPESDYQIRVVYWRTIAPIKSQYIERPFRVRMVLQYMARVGAVTVFRKVLSRLSERRRNIKVAGIGSGIICKVPRGSKVKPGEAAIFFAPNTPPNPSMVVLNCKLVLTDANQVAQSSETTMDWEGALLEFMGWSPYAGLPLDSKSIQLALATAATVDPNLTFAPTYCNKTDSQTFLERLERSYDDTRRPSVVLFGFGNYAKTQILPFISARLDLACIHEIDPDQLVPAHRMNVALDTCPAPRSDEVYDAWFIAGFHHTHSDIANHALRQGAYAIVEKPLATSRRQFESIRTVLSSSSSGKLICCFQRRYSPMNTWAREDLRTKPGEPINYHCIVYEIPLPEMHWYNWPNSGSRILSNGCHWVDHFLYLNDYCRVTNHQLVLGTNGDFFAFLEIENGATFSMVLTDHGSERLGVRDHVELRAQGATVTMVDQSDYRSENSSRILRRRKISPIKPYARMYNSIVQAITNEMPGDSPESLESARATLLLEDSLAGFH